MSDASRYRSPQDVLAFIAAAPRRTINAKQLASRLGVSRTTLWRLRQRDADFPNGVKHPGGKAVRFNLQEVEAYERVRAVKRKMQTSAKIIDGEPTP
ncbi:MAG: helix-turn-helix transcriptional regulator [Hyphomonadaceae bacterium]